MNKYRRKKINTSRFLIKHSDIDLVCEGVRLYNRDYDGYYALTHNKPELMLVCNNRT